MNTPDMTGSLMFMTIGAVLLIAIVALVWFLRKPRNRHPLSDDQPIGQTWETNDKIAEQNDRAAG